MSHSIEVTDQAIVIDGANTPLADIVNAEASVVHDWNRVAVILIVALIGPIIVMIAAVQANGSVDWDYWFGPITLVLTCILGLIGCAIGVAWKRPWGVVIEREDFGHSTLLRCESEDEASSVVAKIQAEIAKR